MSPQTYGAPSNGQ